MRRFKPSDVEEVYEIEKENFPNPWHRSLFLQIHYFNPEGFLVAEENGEIVGYSVFKIKHKPPSVGHLLNLAVEKKHRRQGIGSVLLRTVLHQLENRDAGEVYLEVHKSNTSARRFYSSFGFKEDEEIKNYYGNGENAVIMRLKIKIRDVHSENK